MRPTPIIHILGASGSNKWSGSDGFWIHTARNLVASGCNIHVITPLSKKELLEHDLNLESNSYTRLPALMGKSLPQRVFLKTLGMQRLKRVHTTAEDIVLFSQGAVDIFLDRMYRTWLLNLRCKYISLTQLNTEYNSFGLNQIQAGQVFFSRAETNVFVSYRNLEVARRQFLDLLENGQVIYNGAKHEIDLLPWPPNKTLQLACVGRFEVQTKGQIVLLQALTEFKHLDWKLNFYGDGADLEVIQNAIKHFKLEDKCEIRGYVKHPIDIWRGNHCLLLFSTMEGFPLVVTEAMLAGRVCAVSDVGGNTELFHDAQRHLVASAPNVKRVRDALSHLFSLSQAELQEIGQKNFEIAQSQSLNNGPSILSDLIESLIDHEDN